MKKFPFFLFCFYLLFSSKFLWAQMPVTDLGVATSIVQQIKAIEESTKVLEESQESLQRVKKALEDGQKYLGTISKVVDNAKYLDKFEEFNSKAKLSQERTTRLVREVYKEISESKLSSFLSTSTALLNSLSSNISLIQEILKPFEQGGPKMSDFERLTFLDRKLQETEQKTAEILFQERDLFNRVSFEQVLNRIK
jgi:hypothetical protein